MNQINPYQSPESYEYQDDNQYEYAGFWVRVVAYIIDSLIFLAISIPLTYIFGSFDDLESYSALDVVLNILSMAFIVFCWVRFAGTPGKRILKLKVLDAATGDNLSLGQAILRYIGYIPSFIVLCLGVIWVSFDAKKQGWHDKIAKTVVVKEL